MREASASEPPMKCRKRIRCCQNRGLTLPLGQVRKNPEACPGGSRHVGGAKLNLALIWNVRTSAPVPREKAQAAQTARPKVPMRSLRDGAVRSSAEGSVMGAGAKGLRCSALAAGQLATGGARGQGKAVCDPQAGGLGSLQTCGGEPGSGWSGRAVDCGVRGQPIGQPLQALEPAVVGELFSSAGAAGRNSKGEWRDEAVGHSNGG